MNHLKIYDSFFEIDLYNPRRCEITGRTTMVDVHHIDARGMGGRKSMDRIENLMALTRELHIELGDIKKYKDFLREQHEIYMKTKISLYHRDKKEYYKFILRS